MKSMFNLKPVEFKRTKPKPEVRINMNGALATEVLRAKRKIEDAEQAKALKQEIA
jgi:hypothetical protein